MKTRALATSAMLFTACVAPRAIAATQFWDVNGTASGFGGTGTWDVGATADWNDSTGTASPVVWTNGNDATFQGSASGTATPLIVAGGSAISLGTLTFANTAGNYQINAGAGASLTFTNPTASIVMVTNTTSTNGQILNVPIAGTDITVLNNYTGSDTGKSAARTLLNLNAANTFTGDLILAGTGTGTAFGNANQVAINATGALPSTATVKYVRNFSQLVFSSGGAGGSANVTGAFPNNFNLNASGSGTLTSGIGGANAGTNVTLTGVLSGSANLTFGNGASGGQATIVLANHATYTGNTVMQMQSSAATSGVLRLGIDDALPAGTTLTQGNGSNASSGTFDLAGFSQKLAGLASAGTGFIGGVTNTGAATSTLTISGSATTSYGVSGTNAASANIGVAGSAVVTGSNDNIKLVLDPANTGSLSLVRPAGNSYAGGTAVNGGTLLAGNTSGSATGAGPVTVGPAGRLGSTAGAAGTIAGDVTSSGTLVPGGVGAIGNLTLNAGLTLNGGSNLNFDFTSAANDKLTLASANPDPITVTGAAQSVNVNLNDLGGLKNQTYTLVSFPSTTVSLDLSASGPFKVVAPATGVAQAASFSLANAGNAITLTVSGAGSYLTWRGDATGSGTWNLANAVWTDGAGTVPFTQFSDVTFDDTANGTGPVDVNAWPNLTPAKVTFNNNARDYTLHGDALQGNMTLTKSGTGVLAITTNELFTGGVVLTAGTLAISSDASLGAVPASPTTALTVSKTGTTSATVLRFDNDMTLAANHNVLITQSGGGGGGPSFDTNGHTVTIAGQISSNSNGANLLKIGAGTLVLTGDNSTNFGGGFMNALAINGGTVRASADVNLGKPATGLSFNGGTLQLAASFDPVNRPITLNSGGGTVDTNGFNTTFGGTGAGTGTLTKVGAGTLTLKPATYTPVFANTAGLILNAGKLALDYTGATSPAATVVPLLKSSHDSANFTDPAQKIRTSNAPDPNHGIGYTDDGASRFTLMYTLYGDSNLDGVIDPDDYALLDRGAANALAGWSNGDFDYSGTIDSADYLLIDTNLGLQQGGHFSPDFLSERQSQFGPDYVTQLLIAVPEPATLLAACGLALHPLTRRRRGVRQVGRLSL